LVRVRLYKSYFSNRPFCFIIDRVTRRQIHIQEESAVKKKWIPMLLAVGLLAASPLSFQPVEAVSHAAAVKEDKLPANLENLMTVAPEHQYTLRKGSTRIEVKLLQWTLNHYGLKTEVDGIFGAATDKSVRQYQKDKGLKVDGIVGVNTWVAVYGEYQ
jgi:peptidoglycan hydrolase-like protein with peptidoglycan-binding domain